MALNSFASISNVEYHVRMIKQRAAVQKKTHSPGKKARSIILALLGATILLPILIWSTNYVSGSTNFSDKDYSQLEVAVENTFMAVGAIDITKNKYCEYAAPKKYASKELYCVIEMGAYMNYESEGQAVDVAKKLRDETSKWSEIVQDFNHFYEQPFNSGDTMVVALGSALHNEQCNFYIDSHEKAKRAIKFLPERSENNLIALSFSCDPQSKKEYFQTR